MKFSRYSFISKAGSVINEDAAFACDCCGWVIDGATGLNGKNLTNAQSDASWFSDEWNSYLSGNFMDIKLSLKDIIINGIETINKTYFSRINKKPEEISKLDLPSASIAVIRLLKDRLEYFMLGDCTFIYVKDGAIDMKKDTRLSELDGKVIKVIKELMETGISFEDARLKVNDMLIENRLLKNTQEGYWTLEFDKQAVYNAIYGEITDFKGIEILLMTDGFSAVCDSYKYVNYDVLLKLAEEKGLEHVYNILRDIEESDKKCIRFPRFKKSDDASAVYFFI